ncbi:MAG: hypothetical protein V1735_04180 [Nanoarchaeota archaeon]
MRGIAEKGAQAVAGEGESSILQSLTAVRDHFPRMHDLLVTFEKSWAKGDLDSISKATFDVSRVIDVLSALADRWEGLVPRLSESRHEVKELIGSIREMDLIFRPRDEVVLNQYREKLEKEVRKADALLQKLHERHGTCDFLIEMAGGLAYTLPAMALALELKRRHHRVIIMTPDRDASCMRGTGIPVINPLFPVNSLIEHLHPKHFVTTIWQKSLVLDILTMSIPVTFLTYSHDDFRTIYDVRSALPREQLPFFHGFLLEDPRLAGPIPPIAQKEFSYAGYSTLPFYPVPRALVALLRQKRDQGYRVGIVTLGSQSDYEFFLRFLSQQPFVDRYFYLFTGAPLQADPRHFAFHPQFPLTDGEVMRLFDFGITLGGCGTVHCLLAHGIPMLLFPTNSSQEYYARKVAKLDLGVNIGPRDFGRIPDQHALEMAFQRLTTLPEYRARARLFARGVRLDGHRAVADYLERTLHQKVEAREHSLAASV